MGTNCVLLLANLQSASVDSNTQGAKSLFELANVPIIESCHKNISRITEWKKNTGNCR